MSKQKIILLTSGVLSLVLGFHASVFAQIAPGLKFQARISSPNLDLTNLSGVVADGYVLSSDNCILRAERFSGLTIIDGYLQLVVGKGSLIPGDAGLSFVEVFDNSRSIPGVVCYDSNGNLEPSRTTFDPNLTDGSRKFRLSLTIESQAITADFAIRSAALAINAERLNGKSASQFIQTSAQITQSKAEDWFASTVLPQLLAGTYTAPAAATLTGNISYNQVTGLSAVATSGDYNDLINRPSIPTLPSQTGHAGKVLTTDGTQLSWEAPGSAPVTSVAGRTGAVTLSASDISGLGTLATQNTVAWSSVTATPTTLAGYGITDAASSSSLSSYLPLAGGTLTGALTTSAQIQLNSQNALRFADSDSSHAIALRAPSNMAADVLLTLPAADGTANQVLTTNGAGVLSWQTVSSSGGSVTNVSSANTDISITDGSAAPILTLNSGTTGGAGDANKIAKLNGSGVLAINMIPDLAASKITSGQLSVAQGGTGLSSGNSGGVLYFDTTSSLASSATPTTNGQVLRWNGTNWVPSFVSMFDLRSTLTGSTTFAAGCASNQTLTWVAASDNLSCTNIAISSTQVSGLSQVATSGDYDDLSNKPSIPTLPSQATHAGKVLTTDGTAMSWQSIASAPVSSVAGRTGAVTLSASDISGLGTLATQNTVAWSSVTATPTTLAGYGITDAQPLHSNLTTFSGLSTVNNAVLTTDGSGSMIWSSNSTDFLSQYVLLNGRASGQTILGGINASDQLVLNSTSHATRGNIILNPAGGSVGIGTTTPRAILDVNGSIVTAVGNNTTTSVSFTSGNLQVTTASCGSITLSGMVSGGSYTLAVQGTAGGTCSFSAAGFTVKTSPAVSLVQSANKHALFTFLVMGTNIYVAAIDGF